MKKIVIITATSGYNHKLSLKIKEMLIEIGAIVNIVNLEDYDIPLFFASDYSDKKDEVKNIINDMVNLLKDSDGLVLCAPEYNGSIPPIVTNMISWISVSTENWRDAFVNKISLVATNSGGNAVNYNIAMKNQLEHLGSVVYPRLICENDNRPFNPKSVKKILKDFIKLL